MVRGKLIKNRRMVIIEMVVVVVLRVEVAMVEAEEEDMEEGK